MLYVNPITNIYFIWCFIKIKEIYADIKFLVIKLILLIFIIKKYVRFIKKYIFSMLRTYFFKKNKEITCNTKYTYYYSTSS